MGTSQATIQLKTQIPGPKSQALMAQRREQVARGPFHVTPVFVKKGEGAVLEDVDGNRLIDFASGIAVVNTGHCAGPVVAAIREQAGTLLHSSFNVAPYEAYIRLCTELNRAVPGKGPMKSFLANSGAEAVENAVKIARAHTGRQAVISFDHGFHGRTYMALSLTAKVGYKLGFAPFNPETYRAPFPYVYRWPGTTGPASQSNVDRVVDECFAQFEDLVNTRLHPRQVAAVIFEPVLGEGGFVPMPARFARRLREFCTQHGIVLIADEIQTGFGRTGKMFACEHLGIEADLYTLAKGLADGMPISSVTGRADIMDAPVEGAIGGTFGGNPVSCAAALAVFDMLRDGSVLANANAIGNQFCDRLSRWFEKFPLIGDVRGMGPMMAMEFVKDRTTREPNGDATKKLVKYCYERGLILMSAGTYGNNIRLLPPLTIEAPVLSEGLDLIEKGLEAIS
jgi:4-aminobutyrate aminotransferase/(S)-3-amino-2-methylpropionate transaminase